MAKTIVQIQALIDSRSLDARQLINEIADYLQANPGGGVTPTLAAVLATDNDANGLTIENILDPTTDQQAATKKYVDDNSGGGVTIYTGDGALAGDRIVDLDGKKLSVRKGGNNFLSFDPTAGSETALLQAYNATGNGNYSYMLNSGTNSTANFDIHAEFNDGDINAQIIGGVTSSNSVIDYTADTHIFNGQIRNPELVAGDFADDTAAGVGGISVGGLYHTAGTVKVRLA